ncbi:hypothetical protein E4U22_004604 [Claviceps purpurea]|nr:hypothetical protein E4U51_007836 [Claviceps purpurea]KAG6210352.1 hypothetical protein E4U50_002684 [Claviceps purpurea]KAG6256753.1 hypothetical protein E4U23_000966 [Claviceps purpurea]KAG6258573.1 hypothetical protein E4U24_001685 [Claviceps purpurea]KAG6287084.1 hypothetical protein E4U46_004361 [Claviceps purpurea]
MRVFVALAFACGATAAAVQPLAPAVDAHDIVSANSDLQSAAFDLESAPEELAGLEADHEAFVDAEPLDKRGVASKTILMPAQGSGAKPASNNLEQIQIDFIMGKKPVKQGNSMVPQYYCQSLRFTNKGKLRRRVLVTAQGRTIFQGFMAVRESRVVNAPSGISQFNMEVEAAPKSA